MHDFKAALKTGSDTSLGNEGITHSMIRLAGQDSLSALFRLFDSLWGDGKLPTAWKTANIAPIPKPKEPGSYRPISLISCVCETMERVVLQRLPLVTGLLHPYMYAYTKDTGRATCLATLLTTVRNTKATMVFIDLEMAFELANETAILDPLVKKGVKGRLLSWVKDFLTGRFQGHNSSLHSQHGTPPGLE